MYASFKISLALKILKNLNGAYMLLAAAVSPSAVVYI